jgi:preprotein translocase subunit SecG
MMILFLVLIILACVGIAFFILVQNPKGGGLAGNIAGFNTQFMGVKQTTDVLEKGTWVLAFVIAVLCLVSAAFMSGGSSGTIRGENARPTTTTNSTAPVTAPPATTPPPAQK